MTTTLYKLVEARYGYLFNEAPGNQQAEEKYVKYELPKPVEEMIDGWASYAQNTSIIMVLMATVHAVLIQMLADHKERGAKWEALRWFAYSGLILNASGSVSASLLVSMKVTLKDKARQLAWTRKESFPSTFLEEGVPLGAFMDGLEYKNRVARNDLRDVALLTTFGFDLPRMILFIHFYLSFIVGLFFFLISILLWVVCTETARLAGALVPVVLVGVVPIAMRIWIPGRV